MECGANIVKFSIGGTLFHVYLSTLKRYSQSLLNKLACGELCPILDENGYVYLDRNAQCFQRIVDLMRYQLPMEGCSTEVEMVRADLHYYNLPELLQLLKKEKTTATMTDSIVQADEVSSSEDSLIELNVGGTHYTTSLTTLLRYSSSMLGAMFSGPLPSRRSPDGRVFIDRDGTLFRHVLNFLRTGQLSLPASSPEMEGLAHEADFFQIADLVEAVEKARQEHRLDQVKGTYLEVKDSIICFRGFHISTSLVGPMHSLAHVSPFKEEFQRTGSAFRGPDSGLSDPNGPSLWCNINPFYTAWSKGSIEEVYLNSDSSISRLEWAVKLREKGWQLVNTSSCCSSVSDQTYIVVDKWFLPGGATGLESTSSSTKTTAPPPPPAGVHEVKSTGVQTTDNSG